MLQHLALAAGGLGGGLPQVVRLRFDGGRGLPPRGFAKMTNASTPLQRAVAAWSRRGTAAMSTKMTPPPVPEATNVHSEAADRAYRGAWWVLALYPVSFVLAFVVGEGLVSAITADTGDPAFWQILVAGVPALVVFALPGILSVALGRKAMRLGRADGQAPALIGAVVGAGFVCLNLASYLVGLVFG